jgi:hypothetical protein
MLGAFYTGQLYPGESGFPSSDNLFVQDSLHGLSSDQISLLQSQYVAVDGSIHTHNSESITLTEHLTVSVADTLHGHTIESPSLSQKHYIALYDALHSETVDSPTVSQKHHLGLENTSHELLDSQAELFPGLLIDGDVIQVTDSATLIQNFFLRAVDSVISTHIDLPTVLVELTSQEEGAGGFRRGIPLAVIDLETIEDSTHSFSRGHPSQEEALSVSDNPTGNYTVADSES